MYLFLGWWQATTRRNGGEHCYNSHGPAVDGLWPGVGILYQPDTEHKQGETKGDAVEQRGRSKNALNSFYDNFRQIHETEENSEKTEE